MSDPAKAEHTVLDGRFQLEALLGQGGMAEVFRATDLRHGRVVAVKILRSDVIDLLGVERFRREISVTAAFTHPHILGLLESGETTDGEGRRLLYYVMPLVEGETLGGRLAREDHLSLHDAVRLTREVLEALRYAHEHGVIHRDVKPANILLSGGHAVVADFGIARPVVSKSASGSDFPSLTISGVSVGTPEYMSPEQVFGGETVDGRCDVYAAGCVLYEMLIGRAPFDASTGQAIMARKMTGAFIPPSVMRPGLPQVVDAIIARALQTDPADRYPSAAAFLTALEQLGDTTPLSSGVVHERRAAPSAMWRRPGVIAATILVSLVAVGAWAWYSAGGAAAAPKPDGAARDPSRVAVLPFENLSADTSLAYIANGLTTDLIDELAQVRALTVVSKNGVLPFAHGAIGLDSMARTLRVGSVITGDVRRSGDRVRVSVRLVDARTGQQIASHDTSATIEDVLTVRSSVVEFASRFLREKLGEAVRISTSRQRAHSAEAWELVERVRALRSGELNQAWELPPAERNQRFQHADSLAALAAHLDKAWAEPPVERALLNLLEAETEQTAASGGSEAGREAARRLWRLAVARADEALRRDPVDAAADRARGLAHMGLWRTSRDSASDSLRALAEADFQRAVDHQPNFAAAWSDLSALRTLAGDFLEAEQAAAQALKVDEFLSNAPSVLVRLQFTALGAEDTDKAIHWCAEGQRRYPGDSRFFACELTTLGWTGSNSADVGRAWQILTSAEARYSSDVLRSGWAVRRLFVADVAARAGMRDSALAIIARTRASLPSDVSDPAADYGEAHVRTLLGDRDEAIRLLTSYLARFPIQRRQVARMPWFKSLHGDQRFAAITTTH
jgi:TolB-like protein/tetratricopeptide (TPR) repeat protein